MAVVLVMLTKVDVSRESMTKDTCVLVSQMFLLLGKRRRLCVICQKTLSAESLKPKKKNDIWKYVMQTWLSKPPSVFLRKRDETQRRDSS